METDFKQRTEPQTTDHKRNKLDHHLLSRCATSILITCLFAGFTVQKASCIVGARCDFEKLAGGCYSPANLHCDRDTNLCVCLPGTPISISGRFCVERAKAYESCKYSEQCDNARGFFCYQTDPIESENTASGTESSEQIPKQCDPPRSIRCQCLNFNQDELNWATGQGDNSTEISSLTANNQAQQQHQQQEPAFRAGSDRMISRGRSHYHTHPHSALHQTERNNEMFKQKHYGSSTNHSNPSATIFTRIVWLVLIVSLVSLMLLLFVIKYHSSFKESERPLQRANDDRISVIGEPDVPPPYEVAIRMNV
jgi:hypothetical protein